MAENKSKKLNQQNENSYRVHSSDGNSVSIYNYDTNKEPSGERLVGGLSFGKRSTAGGREEEEEDFTGGSPLIGEIFYYNQLDYGNVPYPRYKGDSATVKSGGCGVCSALMALNNSYGEEIMTVPEMAKFSLNNGGRNSSGTDMSALLEALSKKYKKIKYRTSNSSSELIKHLTNSGCAVINQGDSYPVFSSAGHFVLGLNIAKDKNIVRCLDPLMYDAKYRTNHHIVKREDQGPWVKESEIAKATNDRSPKYWLVTYTGSRNGRKVKVQKGDENLKNSRGQKVKYGVIKDPPASVPQYGLNPDDATYYNQVNWNRNETQGKLYDYWKDTKGSTQSHGVAVIDNCYIVGAAENFVGVAGDIISIVLTNGVRIHAIMGDEKGDDRQNDWGHVMKYYQKYNGPDIVSMVEWCVAASNTSGIRSYLESKNLLGVKIDYFINYGPYF